MQYKTIVLQLLEQQPELYHQLRKHRQLLLALDQFASQLKTLHEEWKETLSEARPGSNESQIASEALEMALRDMEDRLPTATRRGEPETLSLDQAMAFVRSRSPRG